MNDNKPTTIAVELEDGTILSASVPLPVYREYVWAALQEREPNVSASFRAELDPVFEVLWGGVWPWDEKPAPDAA